MTKYAAWQRNNPSYGTRTAWCRLLMASDTVLLTQNPLEETRLFYISTTSQLFMLMSLVQCQGFTYLPGRFLAAP